MAPRERDFDVDVEKGLRVKVEDPSRDSIFGVRTQAKELFAKISSTFVDVSVKGELGVNMCRNASESNAIPMERVKLEGEKANGHRDEEKKVAKEKHKKMSNKKTPKPPRPPREPSLDAADQKLIKEINELAMLKRAKVERMRALKKLKGAKGSSSSNSIVLAMVFTVLFFIVIIFQAVWPRVRSADALGSRVSAETTKNGLIAAQYLRNPSGGDLNASLSSSPNSAIKPIAGSDHPENLRRVAGMIK